MKVFLVILGVSLVALWLYLWHVNGRMPVLDLLVISAIFCFRKAWKYERQFLTRAEKKRVKQERSKPE